ncbi:Short-chain dehydrogenase/reductase SDR [Penicillium hordei]|uniref:Short-chain dehydrogenase/reductase SDR n=1 Tax=Penicillium hordei TaxID=40994 RepID=A0AAD6H6R7_9EURO|nr:Short-chain dehydrogenase/reductase SDR [Penicillium hordei]KAJ5608490.1 Short-chain dehydrogenase/reductase SDR [Penicillium hordei]
MDAATELLDAEAPPSSDQTNRLRFYPRTDIISQKTVRETFRSILSKSPVIHGLINSAGISPQTASIINSDETFDTIIAVNINGVGTSYQTEEEILATTPTASGNSLPIDTPGNGAGVSIVTACIVVGSTV